MDEAMEKAAVEMWNRGVDHRLVAERFGISTRTLKNLLRRYGFEVDFRRRTSWSVIRKAVGLMESGWTIKQTATYLGLPFSTVKEWRRKYLFRKEPEADDLPPCRQQIKRCYGQGCYWAASCERVPEQYRKETCRGHAHGKKVRLQRLYGFHIVTVTPGGSHA